MTKRNCKFEDFNNKKRKLTDDIEALWDNDLDESAFDDCIKLATQVLEEKSLSDLNTTLPAYNVFKEPNIICSTQLDSGIRPSTSNPAKHSNKCSDNDKDDDRNLQELLYKYEEKEGEVSILRIQLKETKQHFNLEQQKIQNELKNKMNKKEKEVQIVRSELQLKDLEIHNLKQKLDLKKRNVIVAQSSLENKIVQHKDSFTLEPKKQVHTENKLYTTSTTVYPLQGIALDSFFTFPKNEKHIIDTKLTNSHRNAIPYLQNQTVATKTIVDKSHINVDTILPAVFHLIKCSEYELHYKENFNMINMVIYGTLQYIIDLIDFLEEIKRNLRTEDILEIDANYLKNCSYFSERFEKASACEIGVKAGVLLNLVAELMKYSDYLRKYILEGNTLRHLDDTVNKHFQNVVKNHSGHDFLNKITYVIQIVGEIRRSDIMSTFLKSSIKLFINISKTRNYNYVTDIFCKFTKELIFSRPLRNIVFEMTYLLKEASQYPSFVNFVLNKSKTSVINNRGLVYFNNDVCRFYIYVLLFDNCITNFTFLPLDVTLNMLCFMYNTYKSSYWIHHQNIKECNCLQQLYKLEMEIVFRALEKFNEEVRRAKQKTCEWGYFFENQITCKILNLMMFHSDELTEKYITVFSQYKEIEKQLQEENLCDLSTLNISEDVPQIASTSFDNLDF